MQKLSNLTLTILVLISSVLGLILVQRGVFALWQEPSNSPANTNLNSIVFTPLTQDINLNGHALTDASFSLDPGAATAFDITGTTWAGVFRGDLGVTNTGFDAQLCLNSGGGAGTGCIEKWTDITGGLGADLWQVSLIDPNDIYYNAGQVGVGLVDPQYALDVQAGVDVKARLYESTSGPVGGQNVFLNFGAGPGTTGHYVQLGQNSADDFTVRTFNASFLDRLVIESDSGDVGLGTASPNQLLHLNRTSGNNAEIDIQSTAAANSHWGIYHDRTTQSLRFWNNSVGGGNLLSLTTTSTVNIDNSAHTAQICLNNDGSGVDCISDWLQGDLWQPAANWTSTGGPGTTTYNQSVYYGLWHEALTPEVNQWWNEGGNIGLGTDTPLTGLHAKINSFTIQSRNPNIVLWDWSTSGDTDWRIKSNVNYLEITPGVFDESTVFFDVAGNDVEVNRPGLFMDSAGNVGVGDADPIDGTTDITFKVKSQSGHDAAIGLQTNQSKNWSIRLLEADPNDLVFRKTNDSGNPTTVLTLKNNSATPTTASGVVIGNQTDGTNTYLHLDLTLTSPPDSTDCNSSGERGRMILGRASNTDVLYVCRQLTGASTYGWYAVTLP